MSPIEKADRAAAARFCLFSGEIGPRHRVLSKKGEDSGRI
jgi:hypothetical protein